MKTPVSRTAKGRAVEELVARIKAKKPPVKVSAVTTLMPADFLKTVDALAKASKLSRSRMIVELVKIGVGEALAELDEDARKALGKEAGRHADA